MREVVADDLVRNRLVLNSGTRSRLKRDRVLCCSLEDGYKGWVRERPASASCMQPSVFISGCLLRTCYSVLGGQTDMATGLWAHVFHCVARN